MEPEMMRILEILRPLWPGIVQVHHSESRLSLDSDKVQVEVRVSGTRWISTVWVNHVVALSHQWMNPEEAAPVLTNQAKRARERTEALMGALGLEVFGGK